MYYNMIGRSKLSSKWSARSPSEARQHIETQVEVLISQHSSLMIHKRAIERQLASIAAQIHEPDVELTPRSVFLLLEIRGSGGVSEQLEQIAHIVHEQGYWKPNGHVQNYRPQDIYYLGKSAQRLFDDYRVVDRRIEELLARLGHMKPCQQIGAETTPQGVYECLMVAMDIAESHDEVNAIVNWLGQPTRAIQKSPENRNGSPQGASLLYISCIACITGIVGKPLVGFRLPHHVTSRPLNRPGQPTRPSWFRWLFVHRSSKKLQHSAER